MKNIINRNNKGQWDGYMERYWGHCKLWVKRFYNNGIEVDYEEFYYRISRKLKKSFYIW